jgi:hypothetical protein
LRGDISEHGIAEKLHALVRCPAVFLGIAFVNERLLDDLQITGNSNSRAPQQRTQSAPLRFTGHDRA